eukprot:366278-Chlamydomonas_euryale.AAC.49
MADRRRTNNDVGVDALLAAALRAVARRGVLALTKWCLCGQPRPSLPCQTRVRCGAGATSIGTSTANDPDGATHLQNQMHCI